MALSGMVPMGPLPQWMYHAQLIAPRMKYDLTVPGLTWVDLVFPFFLFSMGAAIPLALARRSSLGSSHWRLLGGLLKRGLLLGGFAIYVQHISPYVISDPPNTRAWLLAMLGFALLFPALMRLPPSLRWKWVCAVRTGGWLGCAGLLAFLNFRPEGGVLTLVARIVNKSDIIILVLANTAVAAGCIWLGTRRNWPLRMAVMVALVALRLGQSSDGWVEAVWNWTPIPWFYQLRYLQYLLVVLPGTMIGDMILRWRASAAGPPSWSAARCIFLAALTLGIVVGLLVGLQSRRLPETVVVCSLACGVGAWLVRRPQDGYEGFLRQVYLWGVVWLAVGLLAEPYEGGIKKDHATLSYYFVTSGMACFALVLLSVCLDRLRLGRTFGLLTGTGQNPMIAYVGIRSLLAPLVALTGLESLLVDLLSTPWLGVLRAAIKTLLLAAFVTWCTRRRLVWRT